MPALESDDDELESSERNPDFDIGKYDPAFAYKRVSMLYCGHSSSYEEMQPLQDASVSSDARRKLLHDRLDVCLDSACWRTEGLMPLATIAAV